MFDVRSRCAAFALCVVVATSNSCSATADRLSEPSTTATDVPVTPGAVADPTVSPIPSAPALSSPEPAGPSPVTGLAPSADSADDQSEPAAGGFELTNLSTANNRSDITDRVLGILGPTSSFDSAVAPIASLPALRLPQDAVVFHFKVSLFGDHPMGDVVQQRRIWLRYETTESPEAIRQMHLASFRELGLTAAAVDDPGNPRLARVGASSLGPHATEWDTWVKESPYQAGLYEVAISAYTQIGGSVDAAPLLTWHESDIPWQQDAEFQFASLQATATRVGPDSQRVVVFESGWIPPELEAGTEAWLSSTLDAAGWTYESGDSSPVWAVTTPHQATILVSADAVTFSQHEKADA